MTTIAVTAQPFTAPAFDTQPQMPRLRLTSRGRVVLGGLVAVPLAIAALVIGVGAPGATATDSAVTSSLTYVTIEPGQSLWQIAEQVAPQSDPREFVADVLALNQLPSADVQPGQELAVPAAYVG